MQAEIFWWVTLHCCVLHNFYCLQEVAEIDSDTIIKKSALVMKGI